MNSPKLELVLVRVEGRQGGRVAYVTVNNPEKRNALGIAGSSAPEGVIMGHAGALVHGSHGTYAAKRTAIEAAGVRVFVTLNEMVTGVCARLGKA